VIRALLAFLFTAALFWLVQRIASPLFAMGGQLAGITLGTLAAAVISGAIALALFEGRPLTEIGLAWHSGAGFNLACGIALGLGAALMAVGIPFAFGLAHFEIQPDIAPSAATVISAPILLFCGAIGEEIAFRGFALQVLMHEWGAWISITGIGVLFGLLHGLNPGATPLSTLNTAGFGVLFGFALLRSHDLWLSTGIHFAWNTALPFLGVGLSGLTIEITRYRLVWVSTRQIWSGGDYGPEASLIASGLLVILFLAVWRLPLRRGQTALLDSPEFSSSPHHF
jgi:membrane protease YdiL (CAAX protease family)